MAYIAHLWNMASRPIKQMPAAFSSHRDPPGRFSTLAGLMTHTFCKTTGTLKLNHSNIWCLAFFQVFFIMDTVFWKTGENADLSCFSTGCMTWLSLLGMWCLALAFSFEAYQSFCCSICMHPNLKRQSIVGLNDESILNRNRDFKWCDYQIAKPAI